MYQDLVYERGPFWAGATYTLGMCTDRQRAQERLAEVRLLGPGQQLSMEKHKPHVVDKCRRRPEKPLPKSRDWAWSQRKGLHTGRHQYFDTHQK